MDPDNGILAQVRGDLIAEGSHTLPPAAEGLASPRTVVVEAPDLGPVRIRYELKTYRHGRTQRWFWLAVHAEQLVQAPGQLQTGPAENSAGRRARIAPDRLSPEEIEDLKRHDRAMSAWAREQLAKEGPH